MLTRKTLFLADTPDFITLRSGVAPALLLSFTLADRARSLLSIAAPVAIPIATFTALPADALDVSVSPNAPRLGDTITLSIVSDDGTAPTVTVGDRDFPSFPVGPDRYRAFIPTTPLQASGARTIEVIDSGDRASLSVNVAARDFPVQSIWLPPAVNALQGTDYEFDRMDAFRAEVTPDRLWTGAFIDPSDGWISTPFGVRRYYNGEWAANYYHRGLDYAAGMGAPVYAAADGIVGLVDYESNGFEIHGNTIGLNHGQGVTTTYLHLSEIYVSEGDRVQAGETIGAIGSTGISTGPHLHWGFFVHGEAVDPADWQRQGIK